MVQVQRFSIEQGLSDRNVRAIAKDRQGFLWMATDNGLNRFDGYDFLNYDSRPQNRHKIRFNKLYTVLRDRSDRLLLHYYENSDESTIGAPDLLDPLTGRIAGLNTGQGKGFPANCSVYFQAPDQTLYYLSSEKEQVTVYQFDEKTRQFLTVFETKHPGVDNNCFIAFLKAADGTFWFAYNWQAKYELLVIHADAAGRTIRSYRNADFALPPGPVKGQLALTETDGGEILFTLYPQGVYITDPAGDAVFKRHPLLPSKGYYFSKDKAGNLLAYQPQPADPARGCYLITPKGQLLDYSWVFEHQVILDPVFSDDFTAGLLAGSGNGFNIYQLRPERFKALLDKALGNAPYGMSIRGITKLGRDKLFIATELDGLYALDLHTNILTRPGDRLKQLSFLNQFVYIRNLLPQGDSVLWIPGRAGVLKYVPARNELRLYRVDTTVTGKNEVWGVARRKAGGLWLIPREGRLVHLDPFSGALNTYRNKDGSQPLENTQPSFLLGGRDGTVWVGTTAAGLFRIDPDKEETLHYTANPGDPSGFNSNHVTAVYEDETGLLWVCTMESGLHVFDPRKGKVTAIYSRENGLRNNSTVGILPDNKGNYWVSTFNGLSYFDTKLKTFRNYSTADGLSHNEFNRFSWFFDPDYNRYYFGGMNGVNVFDQNDPQPPANDAPLLISEMSVSGPNNSMIVQQEGMVDGSTLTLAPGSRFLRLRLALGTYYNPGGNQFSYKIDGLDQDWNYLGANRELRMDQLPVGTYMLHLRGADDRGNWSKREIALRLVVQEFWYKTWWAYLVYAALFAAGSFYFYRFQLRRRIAEKETHRLQELDMFKTRFFANISHEFRTPLTVILGMLESLKNYFAQGDKPEQAVEMIRRNSLQLLSLVNQLLELSRLESGKLELTLSNGDLTAFLRYQLESFHSFAETRHIQLNFQSELPELQMAFDPEKLQTILVNLISNALKFTPAGGKIDLRFTIYDLRLGVQEPEIVNRQSQIVIQVTDTGAGIPADRLGRIFDRFYQVDDPGTRQVEGTGIGLALVQELVKLMKGAITVESTQGKGTTFQITLPYTAPQPHLQAFAGSAASNEVLVPAEVPVLETGDEDDPRPLLLIAEDNPDVRFYIAGCVQNEYRLVIAGNGEVGIQKAIALVPDIIISDVMMPEKDGFELCEALKNDERTSHIPIVLLTARADFESRIAGLKRGADDYLAKPFEPEELLVRLSNLVRLRRRLQQRYTALPLLPPPGDDPELMLEDAFLLKIREVVEAHLSETDFEMPQLERALGMSYRQVFRKVKALTGTSPSVFIRSVRLHKSKELLLHSTLTIAEIAYEVGFSTPAYFSTTFLEEFGKTPSEFRRN